VLSAIVLAASLGSGSAFAQDSSMTIDMGLSMLELAASKEFATLGITVDPMTLSLNQLAGIKTVLASSDYNRTEKTEQIEAIVAAN
jgi:hypothetical protein